MANTIQNTLNKIGDVVQDIFTGPKEPPVISNGKTTGQTCLEKTGIELRKEHLIRNEWRKNDIEYSRALVLAEYAIQTEFKVSSLEDRIAEKEERAKEREETKKIKAAKKAKEKAEKKARKESEKQKPIEVRKEKPKEAVPEKAQQPTISSLIGNDMFKHGFGRESRYELDYLNNLNEARNRSYDR